MPKTTYELQSFDGIRGTKYAVIQLRSWWGGVQRLYLVVDDDGVPSHFHGSEYGFWRGTKREAQRLLKIMQKE